MVVRARCSLGPCEAVGTANSKGRWKAYLHVIVPGGRTRLGIRARYADAAGLEGSDVASLPLSLPAWARPFEAQAGRRELVLAARLNPELAQQYLAVEQTVGHTFRQDLSMAEIVAAAV